VRALIADHHEPTAKQLRSMLSAAQDVVVVGTIVSGAQLADAVTQLSPNLLFFEPRLPGAGGLRVLDALPGNGIAITIVVTSDHQYALQAFDRHVLDYLIKPVSGARLEIAMTRARRRLYSAVSDHLTTRLLAMVDSAAHEPTPDDCLMVRAGGRTTAVDVGRIDWIEANGNYSRLHYGAVTYAVRETMAVLHHRVGTARFCRIHRSSIVRLDAIRELRPSTRRDCEVVLRTGIGLRVSQAYRAALQRRLAGID
jgi:two-component system LytT family response regulator